ncbi:glycine zipper 2TM domain-containing protein [Aromatoleum toluolicum]|uniref:Glycine zipper 2TM domain-containing protein n=1 Tax=Aromatoleum toluolicum TaxID=90060 RepID=A0ABX1NF61_9RHOO|nr:glycine zipper 2TM domain-containing protein [Aromatoleum toluolicum]NMF97823.1 glycine zipper 2TM domain-containing protein [Aromatoleum toluolicum]
MVMGARQRAVAAAFAAAVLGLGGCATGLGGETYSRGEARRAMTVQYGVVESVRYVKLEGTKTPIGALGGAAIGGIAGSGIGEGRGAAIATVIGAVAGGLAGSAIEEGATRSQGVEVTVRLDNNQLMAVVQDDKGEDFRSGDSVRVVRDGSTTRVTR